MIENTYQEVFLSKPHEYLDNVKIGMVRTEKTTIPVEVHYCPVEEGKNILAAFKTYFENGLYMGYFVSHNTPSDFKPAPLKDILLYGFIEDDMKFSGKFPTGEEINKYYSHCNFSFLYMGFNGKKVFCEEVHHSKEKGWATERRDTEPPMFKYHFENLKDNITRLILLESKPKVLSKFQLLRKELFQKAIKMERIDKLLL